MVRVRVRVRVRIRVRVRCILRTEWVHNILLCIDKAITA